MAVESVHDWLYGRSATIFAAFMVQLLQRGAPFYPGLDDLQHGGFAWLLVCWANGRHDSVCRKLGFCLGHIYGGIKE